MRDHAAGLVTRWAAVWNGDLSLTPATVHEDFVSHAAPLLGGPPADAIGRDHLDAWVAGIRAAIPDLVFTVQVGPVVDDPYVTVRWLARGTYAGGIPGSAPEAVGRVVTFSGTDTLRVRDGRIAEYWANADSLWAAQQLGLVPAATVV